MRSRELGARASLALPPTSAAYRRLQASVRSLAQRMARPWPSCISMSVPAPSVRGGHRAGRVDAGGRGPPCVGGCGAWHIVRPPDVEGSSRLPARGAAACLCILPTAAAACPQRKGSSSLSFGCSEGAGRQPSSLVPSPAQIALIPPGSPSFLPSDTAAVGPRHS